MAAFSREMRARYDCPVPIRIAGFSPSIIFAIAGLICLYAKGIW